MSFATLSLFKALPIYYLNLNSEISSLKSIKRSLITITTSFNLSLQVFNSSLITALTLPFIILSLDGSLLLFPFSIFHITRLALKLFNLEVVSV